MTLTVFIILRLHSYFSVILYCDTHASIKGYTQFIKDHKKETLLLPVQQQYF